MADRTLNKIRRTLRRTAISDATRQAYKTGFQRYTQFCNRYRLKPLPTDEETLCFFVAYLSTEVQYPTIKQYLAAIRFFQLQQGMQDPLKTTPQLSLLLRGVQKQAKPRTRLPISTTLLENIVKTIMGRSHLHIQDRYLYASAMTMAFFGCLRCGEITYPSTKTFNPRIHLAVKDVRISKKGLELTIKRSKTDQLGNGVTVTIGPGNNTTCPLRLLQKFMRYRKRASRSDALFRFHNGSLLTRAKLQTILQESLQALGLPANKFGTHSLRIGSATAAATAGVPMDVIKAMGRWSSECYRQYIKAPHSALSQLTRKLCHPNHIQ